MTVKKKTSLKRAWYGVILLSALLPILILFPWIGSKLHSTMFESALELQEEEIHGVRADVEHEIENLSVLLYSKADDLDANFFGAGSRNERPDTRALYSSLNAFYKRVGIVHSLSLFDENGLMLAHTDNPDHADDYGMEHGFSNISSNPEFVVPIHGRSFVGPPSWREGGMNFVISVPIGSADTPQGVLHATVGTRGIWAGVQERLLERGALIYFVDSRGELLDTSHKIDVEDGTLLTNLAIVRTHLAGEEWDKSLEYQGIKGEAVYGTIASLDKLGWGILSETPVRNIKAPIAKTLISMTGVGLFTFIACAIAGLYLVRRILRHIVELSSAFEGVSQGDYSRLVPGSGVSELDSLASGFNHMAEEIDLREERITKRNELLNALGRAQTDFIGDVGPSRLFDELLVSILSITGSEYGFIGEVLYKESGEAYLKPYAFDNLAWGKVTKSNYKCVRTSGIDYGNLEKLFERVVKEGDAVLASYPSTDQESIGASGGNLVLNEFLGLPFFAGDQMIGMVGVGNRSGGFDDQLMEFLEPILATCGNILEAYRNDQRRKEAEEQISEALKEKEILLSEVHHRVKNNMQVISSLLSLQSMSVKDEEVLEILTTSQNYIKSMALVHEQLYQSKDFGSIDPQGYIESLSEELFKSLNVKSGKISLCIYVDHVLLGVDTAIPCGLVINELLTNSFKYAFPGGRKGKVNILISRVGGKDGDMIELLFHDNGIGLPEGLDIKKTKSFGLRLVTNLVAKQLHGEMEIIRSSGTEYRIRFPRLGTTDHTPAQGGEYKGVQNG